MAAKHLPATVLPWRVGDAGHTIFGPPNGLPSPAIVATVNNKVGNRRLVNAAYIAHAANAYPKLIAALCAFCKASTYPGSEQIEGPELIKVRNFAKALLRKLGELPVT